MADMLLTDADLERITGCKRPGDQIMELTKLGIRHTLNKRREIVVLWSAVEVVLGPQAASAGPTAQPDVAALQ